MILHRITPFMYHILFDNGVAMEKTILLYQWKLLNIFLGYCHSGISENG